MKTSTKPKVLEEKVVSGAVHLLVRVDTDKQITNLVHFCKKLLLEAKSISVINEDFHDVFKFNTTTFGSARIIDKYYIIDYLIIDEGQKAHTAFINFVIHADDDKLKKVSELVDNQYFEL